MNTKLCPTCKTPIPANAPGGFCPACILRDADELPSARTAPSLDEVRAAFPQLEVEALIGQGGMGFVYKARQPSLDRIVALKILSPELSRDPAFAERFAREARVLGKLNHPNIVTVFESGESGGFFYLLMEYVDGVNLRQAMRAGRFTPQQALAVVPGICDALQAAHAQGVWHRDIKPENILLDGQGGVKIVDFGIARIVGDPARDFTLTSTGGMLGSAAYMAPEQHEKPHDVDHRADIYSLGVVFYEMLTGELPLGRFKAPSAKSAVDARIDEIVFRTLEKERELRQQSAAEVKTDVARAARSSAPEPENHPAKPAGITLWSLGLILVGAIVYWLGYSLRYYRPTGEIIAAVGVIVVILGLAASFYALWQMKHGIIPPVWRGVLRKVTVFPALAAWWKEPPTFRSDGDDGKPSVLAVRSVALFLGGILVCSIALRGVLVGFITLLGALSACFGYAGMWAALSQMKRGIIPPVWQRGLRVLVWGPIVAFAACCLLYLLWNVRTRNPAALTKVEPQQSHEASIAASAKRAQDAANLAEATLKSKELLSRFPDHSTPEGAVVAYQNALISGDTARLLAAIPSSVAASAVNPVGYAKELIAANRDSRGVKDDTYILISASIVMHPTPLGVMDTDMQRAIMSRDPGLIKVVSFTLRALGKNPGVSPGIKVCVQEGTEWRVFPRRGPSQTHPAKVTPTIPIEDVFRAMNTLANESNGEAFRKSMEFSRFGSGFSAPVAEYMEPFLGKIRLVKAAGSQPESRHIFGGNPATTAIFAALEDVGGKLHYRDFHFTTKNGAWHYYEVADPYYRATCRIEFRPEKGDALAILRTHLRADVVLLPVAGEQGQFDIQTEQSSADYAESEANEIAKQVQDSLKKAGQDGAFKIIKKAEKPTKPWRAEEAVPLEKAK